MSTVIKVEGLSKQYLIRHQKRARYTALRDVISEGARSLGRKLLSPFSHADSEEFEAEELFWALRDINFEVKQGDRLGIIGRNGAGKSTLLKLLSRITEPTKGRISIKGRLSSLLEVGTGFHPELTGRENIYLNGAILGMSRQNIKQKFDEIVAFADVEKFLDTPVKRYSSGMYMRLAFSVAAHLEPEILVIDEVLAVGDAAFQKKCLGKMEEVGKQGRTILFVSHNMNAIEQLCTKAIFLQRGSLLDVNGSIREAVVNYIYGNESELASSWINNKNEHENPWFQPMRFYMADGTGNVIDKPARNDDELWVYIEGKVKVVDPAIQVGYALYNEEGTLLFWTLHNDVAESEWPVIQEGMVTIRSRFPYRMLNEGTYRLEMINALYFRKWLCEPQKNAPYITINIHGGLSDSPCWMIKRPGILAPIVRWSEA